MDRGIMCVKKLSSSNYSFITYLHILVYERAEFSSILVDFTLHFYTYIHLSWEIYWILPLTNLERGNYHFISNVLDSFKLRLLFFSDVFCKAMIERP